MKLPLGKRGNLKSVYFHTLKTTWTKK